MNESYFAPAELILIFFTIAPDTTNLFATITNMGLCHNIAPLFIIYGNLGCWVLLDKATREKYCFNVDGEAWSMAIGTNNVLYLDSVTDTDDPKVRLNTSPLVNSSY